MKLFFKYLLIINLILGIGEVGIAQIEYQEKPIGAINALKSGILVVILPSNHKKITFLEKELKNPLLKKGEKKRKRKLIKLERERDELLKKWAFESFKKNYDFSDFAFVYDTAIVHIKKGTYNEIFLKDNETKTLEGKNVFMLRYGHTNYSNTTGKEAWVVTDSQFQDLERPFPYYVGIFRGIMETVMTFLFSTYIPPTNTKIGAIKGDVSYTLNQKLWAYYNRVN